MRGLLVAAAVSLASASEPASRARRHNAIACEWVAAARRQVAYLDAARAQGML